MSKDKNDFSCLRLFKGKVAIIGFLSIGMFVFSQCKNQKRDLLPGQAIRLSTWRRADVIRYCLKNQIDTNVISSLTELALFRESEMCSDTVKLQKPLRFPAIKESIEKIYADKDMYQMTMSLCGYIYTTVPELYLDYSGEYRIKYKINKQDLLKTLGSLQSGTEIAQCGEYASLAAELLTSSGLRGRQIIASARSMSTDSGHPYNHTICIFYYQEEEKKYGVVIDPMYGYIYPTRGSKIVELSDLQSSQGSKYGHLIFLPDSILSQKRFLTDSIWPCNFMSAPNCSYYKGESHALRQYELHQAEDIRLLNFKPMDTIRYEMGLREILIKNIPRSL